MFVVKVGVEHWMRGARTARVIVDSLPVRFLFVSKKLSGYVGSALKTSTPEERSWKPTASLRMLIRTAVRRS